MCPIHRESRIGLEQFRRGDRSRKQSAGFSVRQRFQQNAVNHREDRCDGANAQRERQNGEGGEGLLAGENSKGMFHAYLILPNPAYGSRYPEIMAFSRLLPVRQHFPDRSIGDIPAAIARELASSGFGAKLKPGSRVAIGVGSRGIANIARIVRSVVDFWKSRECQPFLFPAMGSHGAATAEGQASVLAHLGVTETAMGCPVVSALEVVPLGKTPDGIEAFMDRNAFESDGVFLGGRVKWHTDFAGKIESGLFKMMAIGLGKFAGAQNYHTYAYRLGLEHVIRTVGRQVLASGKILGGLAILEDANHNTAQLTAVPVALMEQKEEELLALVKSWMGRIPMPLDILILDEIGKTISGAGMDTKVVNRSEEHTS